MGEKKLFLSLRTLDGLLCNPRRVNVEYRISVSFLTADRKRVVETIFEVAIHKDYLFHLS